MGVSYKDPEQPQLVPYMDLGGGLNTRLDPHALARNELAVSQNLWSSYDGAVAKRPGSQFLINTVTGQTPANLPAISLSSCRYLNVTWLILCNTNRDIYVAPMQPVGIWTGWQKIGSVGAGAKFVTTAQMFDPQTNFDTVFFADGVSPPQRWPLDAFSLRSLAPVDQSANHLPYAYNSTTAFITPQFVKTLGNNSHLFYSGEPSNRSAVYVSDPFYPQVFTSPSMQIANDPPLTSGPPPNPPQYYPGIIGNNDGVDGGDIVGLETLGSVMLVFKQAAVYSLVQTTLLGEVPAWQPVQVSPSIGCAASRSIARFDAFVVFLAIDGVYMTDAQTVQKISRDVPTYFDSSLTGTPAIIRNRSGAIGVRHGNRYEIFFTAANPDGSIPAYCNMGMWFDFDKQSRFANPIAGEIDGMNVGGAVTLRGPQDDGNVAWADALVDRVGEFGIGYSDYGNAISTMFAGKADLFDDVFGPEQIVARKQMQDAYLLVEVLQVGVQQSLDFYGQVTVDFAFVYPRVILQPDTAGTQGGEWGENWLQMIWTASYMQRISAVKIPMQNAARGLALQVAIKESSTVPWIAIGYGAYVNMGRTEY